MLDLTLCGSCAVSCLPFFNRKKKRKKEPEQALPVPVQVEGPSSSLLFLPADNIVVTKLIEDHNIGKSDVYVFNMEMVYISCSGPARWIGDANPKVATDFIGSSPKTDERLPAAFAKNVVPLLEQTLNGHSLKVITLWQGQTYLLTTYPIMTRAERAIANKHRKRAVVGGMLITQPCEGMPYAMASFATKSTDSGSGSGDHHSASDD